jgi:hypothetical protein
MPSPGPPQRAAHVRTTDANLSFDNCVRTHVKCLMSQTSFEVSPRHASIKVLHLAFRNALRDARLSRTGAQSPIAVRAHMHAALPPRPLAGAIAAARSLFVVLAITVGALDSCCFSLCPCLEQVDHDRCSRGDTNGDCGNHQSSGERDRSTPINERSDGRVPRTLRDSRRFRHIC